MVEGVGYCPRYKWRVTRKDRGFNLGRDSNNKSIDQVMEIVHSLHYSFMCEENDNNSYYLVLSHSIIIRMTTSQKYRFPTADCDEMEKDQVRQAEARVKQKEAKVAEILFMPSAAMRKLEPKPKPLSTLDHHRGGLRTSARQREKQERLRAIEEERRAEALHAGMFVCLLVFIFCCSIRNILIFCFQRI